VGEPGVNPTATPACNDRAVASSVRPDFDNWTLVAVGDRSVHPRPRRLHAELRELGLTTPGRLVCQRNKTIRTGSHFDASLGQDRRTHRRSRRSRRYRRPATGSERQGETLTRANDPRERTESPPNSRRPARPTAALVLKTRRWGDGVRQAPGEPHSPVARGPANTVRGWHTAEGRA
jgi:hypothetical protein